MRQCGFLIFWLDGAISYRKIFIWHCRSAGFGNATDLRHLKDFLRVKLMMPINNAYAEAEVIADEFGFFEDWEDRYQMLIDQGRKLAPIPEKYRHDDFRLRGCQSVVYFAAERDPVDKITFMAQSDAAIVQGLVALLLRVYSGRTAQEIRETEPDFLSKIGLDSHLSVTRKNGLASMLNAIKSAASLQP
jgi:cysteine desulfuration protein SufE